MSLTRARLAIAGIVMKWDGSSWVIGEAKPRVINGRASEEIPRPSYADNVRSAFYFLLGKALDRLGSDDAKALYRLMCGLELVTTMRAALGVPQFYVRTSMEAHGWDRAELARRSGVSWQTVDALLKGRDVKTSTLLKIVEAFDE